MPEPIRLAFSRVWTLNNLPMCGKAHLPWGTTDPNTPLRARHLGSIPFHIPHLCPDIIEGLRFPLVPDAQHYTRGECLDSLHNRPHGVRIEAGIQRESVHL